MTFSMAAPIVLIVVSNIFYNVCSKETPANINPLASLTVTYAVGAVFSAILYYALNKNGNLMREYANISWSSFVLGLAIVGLESGSIYMYKAGWNVSSGQMVYSIILAVCLVFIGIFVYKESVSTTKIIGILVCMFGLFLINK